MQTVVEDTSLLGKYGQQDKTNKKDDMWLQYYILILKKSVCKRKQKKNKPDFSVKSSNPAKKKSQAVLELQEVKRK